MTRKMKKTQKAVLKALGNYRRHLLKEYLIVCKSLSEEMSSLFKNGVDTENGSHLSGKVAEDVGKDLPSFNEDTINQAKKLLAEILSGYWNNDPEKLFEILDPSTDTFSLFNQYQEKIITLMALKESFDMAGEDLSKYLKSN